MTDDLPLEDLLHYQQKMDKKLIELKERTARLEQTEESVNRNSELSYDLYTIGNEVFFEIELPGVSSEDFSVELTPRYLQIQGERRLPEVEGEPTYHAQQRRRGKFNYMFNLPSEEAHTHEPPVFKDGVLYLKLQLAKDSATN